MLTSGKTNSYHNKYDLFFILNAIYCYFVSKQMLKTCAYLSTKTRIVVYKP